MLTELLDLLSKFFDQTRRVPRCSQAQKLGFQRTVAWWTDAGFVGCNKGCENLLYFVNFEIVGCEDLECCALELAQVVTLDV